MEKSKAIIADVEDTIRNTFVKWGMPFPEVRRRVAESVDLSGFSGFRRRKSVSRISRICVRRPDQVSRMHAHSGGVLNILNGRAFRIFRTSGTCPVFVMNARAFRTFVAHSRYPECARIQNIQDAEKRRPKYHECAYIQDIHDPPECARIQEIQGAFRMS